MLKRRHTASPGDSRPRLRINFNRKVLTHATLKSLKDALEAQGQVRGEAISGVIDDLMKLRYLCEEITNAHKAGNNKQVQHGIEMLKLVL